MGGKLSITPWRKKPRRSLVGARLRSVHVDLLQWILKPGNGSSIQSWHLEAEVNQALIEIRSTLSSGPVINHGIHYQRSAACLFFFFFSFLKPQPSSIHGQLYLRWELLGAFTWPWLCQMSHEVWETAPFALKKWQIHEIQTNSAKSSQFQVGKGWKKQEAENLLDVGARPRCTVTRGSVWRQAVTVAEQHWVPEESVLSDRELHRRLERDKCGIITARTSPRHPSHLMRGIREEAQE